MKCASTRAGLLLAFLFALAAPIANAGSRGDSLVRGFIHTGDASGIWTVRPCGNNSHVPIKDKTPGDSLTVAVAEIKGTLQGPQRDVFVEFEGSLTREQAVAQRLWRVLGFVVDCRKAPGNVANDATFWAAGNEPAWQLVVRGKRATLTRFGRAPLNLPAAPSTPQTTQRSYEARNGSTRLTIEVDEAPCLDPLAETAYGAVVIATVREEGDAHTLRGCAARY